MSTDRLWRHKPKPTFTTTARAHAAHVHHHLLIPSFCRPSTCIPFHHLLLSIFLPLDTSPKHPLPLLPLPFAAFPSIFLPLDANASPNHPLPFHLSAVCWVQRKPSPGIQQVCFYVSLRNGLSITMAVQHIYWSSHYYRWEDYTQFLCVTGY